MVQLWALVAVERWWCGCEYLLPSEGGGAGEYFSLSEGGSWWWYGHGPSSPVEGGGVDVGPRRQLKVGCGYGPSSPFESAGVGMGVRRC
jgi:hypothetical protein